MVGIGGGETTFSLDGTGAAAINIGNRYEFGKLRKTPVGIRVASYDAAGTNNSTPSMNNLKE